MSVSQSSLTFDVLASDPNGRRCTVIFTIHAPIVGPGRNEFICRFDVSELGISGSAFALNPFLAIKYSLFKIRTEIMYRYSDWKFYYITGEEMGFDFDDCL